MNKMRAVTLMVLMLSMLIVGTLSWGSNFAAQSFITGSLHLNLSRVAISKSCKVLHMFHSCRIWDVSVHESSVGDNGLSGD